MHRHTLKALFFLKAVEPNDKKDDWRKKQPWTPMDDDVLDLANKREGLPQLFAEDGLIQHLHPQQQRSSAN